MLYISWFEQDPNTGETTQHQKGPFCSVSPDGCGAVIGQPWTCYQATDKSGNAQKITVPSKYHTITAYRPT